MFVVPHGPTSTTIRLINAQCTLKMNQRFDHLFLHLDKQKKKTKLKCIEKNLAVTAMLGARKSWLFQYFFRGSCYDAAGELLIPFMLQKITMDLCICFMQSRSLQICSICKGVFLLYMYHPWASCCTIRGGMCKNELFFFCNCLFSILSCTKLIRFLL